MRCALAGAVDISTDAAVAKVGLQFRSQPLTAEAPICLVVHQGFSVRYLLQTDILLRLLDRGRRVVVLAPSYELSYVRKVVPSDVAVLALPPMPKQGRLERWLRMLRHFLQAEHVSTAHEIYKRMLAEAPNRANRVVLRILHGVARAASCSRGTRRFVPWLEGRVARNSSYIAQLRSMGPALVVVTSTGAFGDDAYVVRAAQSARIPVVTVILSWDNTSSTGYPAAFGDYVVTWTKTMKREAIHLLDYRPEQVFVKGIAHFDVYHRPDAGFDRSTVLRHIGLDPMRRTVMLATKSPKAYGSNAAVADLLARAMMDGRLPNAQLVIRIHPIHYRRGEDGELLFGKSLARYVELAERYPHVHVSAPLLSGESRGHVMAGDEMVTISRLLRSCDVVVNMFSTMNIEAALLDKAIVNVCFQPEPREIPPSANPARFDIDSDAIEHHNMRIADSGGTRVAYSADELIEHVRAYLDSPNLDADPRRRIALDEGGPFPGCAGRMIADFLLHVAGSLGRRS